MNGKKHLYILATMFVMALLATPAVSADSHTDNEYTENAARNKQRDTLLSEQPSQLD